MNKNWVNFDQEAFDNTNAQWEWNKVASHENFPIKASGSSPDVVQELYMKY